MKTTLKVSNTAQQIARAVNGTHTVAITIVNHGPNSVFAYVGAVDFLLPINAGEWRLTIADLTSTASNVLILRTQAATDIAICDIELVAR